MLRRACKHNPSLPIVLDYLIDLVMCCREGIEWPCPDCNLTNGPDAERCLHCGYCPENELLRTLEMLEGLDR